MKTISTTNAFASTGPVVPLGGRLFRKEVLRVGEWVHPATGQRVAFSHEDLQSIASETNRWIGAQGGRIPFLDGHRADAVANLGYWLSVAVEGDRLYGVVEAGTDEIAGRLGTTIRDVSVYLESEATDSHGNTYTGVVTHIAATPFPVLDSQENFVRLSRDGAREATRVPVLRLASRTEGRTNVSALKGIAEDLGLACNDMDDAALEAEIRKKLKTLREEKDGAIAASTQALSAKTGEVTALAGRLAELEKDIAEREQVECDREVSEVKALAAKNGRPDALDPAREKFIRDRWVRDREAAKQMLALAREVATTGAGTKIEGAAPVKTPDKESVALAKADAIETAKREARAMGWATREENGKLFAFKPGEKREVVLVG